MEQEFGIEQEFSLLDVDDTPVGWKKYGYPRPQGPYILLRVGSKKVFCRETIEAHYRCCLHAGIAIYGTNAEVMPSQWEYQVGL